MILDGETTVASHIHEGGGIGVHAEHYDMDFVYNYHLLFQ